MRTVTLAVDISNYSSDLTSDNLAALKAAGVGLVITQAVDPPPQYPPTKTRDQIAACNAAGMPVDAYLWVWTNSDVRQDMLSKLGLLEGVTVRRLWLDAEDTAVASVTRRRAAINEAFTILDEWSSLFELPRPGLYTGKWWIDAYLDGDASAWGDRDLWLAQYDAIPDASVVTLPKGWTRCAIKQYSGTSDIAGVTGVDLNVLSVEEAMRVGGDTMPEPVDAEWQAKKEKIVNSLGYIAGDLVSALHGEANRKFGPRRATVNQLADAVYRVATEALT